MHIVPSTPIAHVIEGPALSADAGPEQNRHTMDRAVKYVTRVSADLYVAASELKASLLTRGYRSDITVAMKDYSNA